MAAKIGAAQRATREGGIVDTGNLYVYLDGEMMMHVSCNSDAGVIEVLREVIASYDRLELGDPSVEQVFPSPIEREEI